MKGKQNERKKMNGLLKPNRSSITNMSHSQTIPTTQRKGISRGRWTLHAPSKCDVLLHVTTTPFC
jgi:hypothetical protein